MNMIGKPNTNSGECTINPMENCVKLPEVGNRIVSIIERSYIKKCMRLGNSNRIGDFLSNVRTPQYLYYEAVFDRG